MNVHVDGEQKGKLCHSFPSMHACIPEAIVASRSCAFAPGLVALTARALIRTENRDPFSRCSAMPLYSHDMAHGMMPKSPALAIDPNMDRDCPAEGEFTMHCFNICLVLLYSKSEDNYPTLDVPALKRIHQFRQAPRE